MKKKNLHIDAYTVLELRRITLVNIFFLLNNQTCKSLVQNISLSKQING